MLLMLHFSNPAGGVAALSHNGALKIGRYQGEVRPRSLFTESRNRGKNAMQECEAAWER